MARGRMISKSLGASKRFTDLQTHAGKLWEFSAALFCLVVSNCDDFGRLEGDAASVKWRCWPASSRSEHDFAVSLKAMHDAGLIIWYEVADRHIVEVVQFSEHQSGLHKRTRSKFPDPPGYSREAVQSTNHVDAPSPLLGRAGRVVERYTQQYLKLQQQPYLQSRVQMDKDLEAATALVKAYKDADVDRIVTAFLKLDENHSKNRLLKGSRRTLPMLLSFAAPIATQLKIKASP